MLKKMIADVLLGLSKKTAELSGSTISSKGYCQPKEPEAIAKLRNSNVSRNK